MFPLRMNAIGSWFVRHVWILRFVVCVFGFGRCVFMILIFDKIIRYSLLVFNKTFIVLSDCDFNSKLLRCHFHHLSWSPLLFGILWKWFFFVFFFAYNYIISKPGKWQSEWSFKPQTEICITKSLTDIILNTKLLIASFSRKINRCHCNMSTCVIVIKHQFPICFPFLLKKERKYQIFPIDNKISSIVSFTLMHLS